MIDYASVIIIAVVSLVAAVVHNGSLESKSTECEGFRWGYFTIYSTFFGNIFLLGSLLVFGGSDGALIFLLGAPVATAVFYLALQRKKVALIASTILSFNPLWMIINIFYLANRWDEFGSETTFSKPVATTENQASIQNLNLPREIRLSLFIAAAWIVCVPLFVFIFSPYGNYMRNDDTNHMLGVMFFPAIIGLALFYIYQKYIRN